MTNHVLICDRFAFEARNKIQSHPEVELRIADVPTQPSPAELEWAHILVCRSTTKIHEKLLDQAPNLKFIVTATSGFDHIDLEETGKRGIKTSYCPEGNAQSAAEITWSLLLASIKKLIPAQQLLRDQNWDRKLVLGHEVHNRSYGIIGLGRVGRRVAKIARAFDMNLFAYDPYVDEEVFKEFGVQRLGFDELFIQADIVSVHVPRTKETTGFIKSHHLDDLGPQGIFINTSRGSVVRTDTLTRALETKAISAVALDVFEREPLDRNSPLLKHPKVTLSPHIGGNTVESFERASLLAADGVIHFLKEESIPNSLPPQTLWYTNPAGKNS